jgi:predicted O-methyltransferase YrrM
MEFISEELEQYIEAHTSEEPALLAKLNRETHLKIMQPRMLSGHFQGRVLSMLSCMLQPKLILEIGTYTGYSALCLAEGLTRDGILYTIDINEERAEFVNRYISEAGMQNRIIPHIGNAIQVIPEIEGQFDLVFIDADKGNYSAYFNLVIDRVRKGGLIIADNVLWSGKVLETLKPNDTDTLALLEYNRHLAEDSRLDVLILPVRDGLSIARKR